LSTCTCQAIQRDRQARQKQAELKDIQERVNSLTPREHQVFTLVVTGMLNKQIAFDLGTNEKTIKVHRARVMQKMKAESLADLVRLAEKVDVHPPED
jgi:FixJ family two-component response regulator